MSLKWYDRYNAALSRDYSRYNRALREKPDAPLPSRDMDLRRHRFGVRGGAFAYMLYRVFGKAYVERKFRAGERLNKEGFHNGINKQTFRQPPYRLFST